MTDERGGPFEALLESWRLGMEVAELSKNTILSYLRGVTSYLRWCAQTGQEPTFAKVQIQLYMVASKDECGHATSTRILYLTAIRRFVAWAVEEGEAILNEVGGVEYPTPGKTIPPALTLADHEALLATCDPKTFLGKRDAALFMMLLTSGCRASEILGIHLEDINVRARRVLVHGKGRQDRISAFTSATALAVDRYVRARKTYPSVRSGEKALWINRSGEALQYRGLDSMIGRRAARAGIEGVHAHQWRHLWAGRFLWDGGDRGALKLLGGWKSDAMVEHYTQRNAAELALKAYDELYGNR
jgi:site-specific recombinase XerD